MKKSHIATTGWEKVKDWYDATVGAEGHYYHRKLIFPKLFRFWRLKEVKKPSVLDLACGQGVLARQLPENVLYAGVDVSPSLIKFARQMQTPTQQFFVGDITKSLPDMPTDFSHATIILALQNVENPLAAIRNAFLHLRPGGILSLVINHPAFRIPRQSSWGIDENKKLQYRRVDSYMSSMQIPIQIHPGKRTLNSEIKAFHWSISQLSAWLKEAGFFTLSIEEWCSDKNSTGAKAKIENRARLEFPLFMTVHAIKP